MAQKNGIVFLTKIRTLLSAHPIIARWSDQGLSFLIVDEKTFSEVTLPYYFKYNNIAAFTKLLMVYGFEIVKVQHLQFCVDV
jgi:hypothetical protein